MKKLLIMSAVCLASAIAPPALAAEQAPAASSALSAGPTDALTPKEIGDKIGRKYAILAYNSIVGSSQPIDITMPDWALSAQAGKYAASPDCLIAVATQVGVIHKSTQDAQLLSAAMAAAQCAQQKFDGKAVVALFSQSSFGTTGRPEGQPIWSGS